MGRGYQNDYSASHHEKTFNPSIRKRKADTIIAVLEDYLGDKLPEATLLDFGCAAGFLASELAERARQVTGIDIDTSAVEFAQRENVKPNLRFVVVDGLDSGLPQASFDVVTCVQIYEHVSDAAQMFDEILRVLKPGGVCYFAATNRLDPWEHHYKLPLLSVIPRPLAHWYLRLMGKGDYYYEKQLTYWTLRRLTRKFELIDYTRKLVNEPERFKMEYMVQPGTLRALLAGFIVNYVYWLSPGYVWILRKP